MGSRGDLFSEQESSAESALQHLNALLGLAA